MKLNNILLFACFICLLSACKSDSKANTTEGDDTHEGHDHSVDDHAGHDHAQPKIDEHKYDGLSEREKTKMMAIDQANANKIVSSGKKKIDISSRGLPNPCQLITPEWINKNTSLKITDPRIKQGNSGAGNDSWSCFFQWEQDGDPNTGFLINVMINPVPEEVVDYPETYMQAKRVDGETMMGSDKPFPYKRLDGLGIEALGCKDLGKYYWRIDNEYLFMLAYNIEMSDSAQRAATVKIGNEIIKNFKESLNK